VPDGIDAAMNPMQPARRDPPADPRLTQAGSEQLGEGDDTVLARGDASHRGVRADEFSSHPDAKSSSPPDSPRRIRCERE
jgi:hypothetical protein